MKLITNIMVPSITLFIIIYGLIKKVPIFDTFILGVKEGLKMILNIFPTILAMIISINILLKSNIIYDLASFLSFTKIPTEIIPMALLRPISGSSSLIMMNNILINYGADSFIGRVASVIQGSTDTTIYIIGLYFGSIGIKKIRYSLTVGLITDFICVILAIVTVSILF